MRRRRARTPDTHPEQSGLTQRVLESEHQHEQVAADLLAFLRTHVPAGRGLLAGSSVHADRVFLARWMPEVVEHLHYRIIDVSTGTACLAASFCLLLANVWANKHIKKRQEQAASKQARQ